VLGIANKIFSRLLKTSFKDSKERIDFAQKLNKIVLRFVERENNWCALQAPKIISIKSKKDRKL
jgi:hypothetical protein